MKRATIVLSTLLASCAGAHAEVDDWYGSVKTSFGFATMSNIRGDGIGALRDETIDDQTAGVGFSFGKRMSAWLVEAEYIWRYRTDWNNAFTTPPYDSRTNVFANVGTHTFLLNVLRHGAINRSWSWQIGAGAGLVNNHVDGTYVERAVPGVSPELRFDDERRATEFTYAVTAGVTRARGGPWVLGLRYRYIDLGDLRIGPFAAAGPDPGRPGRAGTNHTSHELVLSFERRF